MPLLDSCGGIIDGPVKEVTHTVHDESSDLEKTVHSTVKQVQQAIGGIGGIGGTGQSEQTLDSVTNTAQHIVKHAEDTSQKVCEEVPSILSI